MKTFFLTFALLLTGASVFATDTAVEPVDDNLVEISIADADIIMDVLDDEICYSVTVQVGGTIGPINGGISVTVTGCGNSASAAWAELQRGLRLLPQQ